MMSFIKWSGVEFPTPRVCFVKMGWWTSQWRLLSSVEGTGALMGSTDTPMQATGHPAYVPEYSSYYRQLVNAADSSLGKQARNRS